MSDPWLMSRLSHRPSEPAYYIVGCRISRNQELNVMPVQKTGSNRAQENPQTDHSKLFDRVLPPKTLHIEPKNFVQNFSPRKKLA